MARIAAKQIAASNGSLKKWLGRLLPMAFSALFLYLVFRRVEWGRLLETLRTLSYPLLAPVVAVYLLGFIPRAKKWQLILEHLKPVSLASCLGYSFVGCAGNAVLPARLGELVRAFLCGRREGAAATAVLSTIVLERVLEVLSLMLLFSLTVWLTGRGELQTWALLGLGACLGLIALLFVMQRRGGWLVGLAGLVPAKGLRERLIDLAQRFLEGLAVVRAPGRLFLVLALGLAVYLIEGSSYWLLAMALGLKVSYVQSLFVLCFIFVGMLVPAAVGNIGPLQYFCVLGFSFFGVEDSAALVYSVFLNAMLYVPALIGLICLARYGLSLESLRKQAPQAALKREEGAS
ncbi:hypothetical protein AAU61_00915 [Desulfocarbo indianensis]|nr:hypothetical protein AAU61_00915 [Desulfocarbo indianensis]